MGDREGAGPQEKTSLEQLPEWGEVLALVEGCVTSLSGRHPGIVAEAVVANLVATYGLAPRETHHAERRKNHPERVRRLAHEAFRILEAEPDDARAARRIAAGIVRAFTLARHGEASAPAAPGA